MSSTEPEMASLFSRNLPKKIIKIKIIIRDFNRRRVPASRSRKAWNIFSSREGKKGGS
jgi:hypothetical protein